MRVSGLWPIKASLSVAARAIIPKRNMPPVWTTWATTVADYAPVLVLSAASGVVLETNVSRLGVAGLVPPDTRVITVSVIRVRRRPVTMETLIRVRIAMGRISTATTALPYPEASPEALSPVATVRSILPAVRFVAMARATVMKTMRVVRRIAEVPARRFGPVLPGLRPFVLVPTNGLAPAPTRTTVEPP